MGKVSINISIHFKEPVATTKVEIMYNEVDKIINTSFLISKFVLFNVIKDHLNNEINYENI